MSEHIVKIKASDETRLGTHAAQQPLSGIKQVGSFVTGLGNAGYIRKEEAERKSA